MKHNFQSACRALDAKYAARTNLQSVMGFVTDRMCLVLCKFPCNGLVINRIFFLGKGFPPRTGTFLPPQSNWSLFISLCLSDPLFLFLRPFYTSRLATITYVWFSIFYSVVINLLLKRRMRKFYQFVNRSSNQNSLRKFKLNSTNKIVFLFSSFSLSFV